jgi:hypothetical protein
MSKLLKILVDNQLENIKEDKMTKNDIFRISKFMDNNFFTDKCCTWKGYIHRQSFDFFFFKQKIAVKRLLYCNYIGPLKRNEKIISVCGNNNCCNVKHFITKKTRSYARRSALKQKKNLLVKIETANENNKIMLDFHIAEQEIGLREWRLNQI